MSNTVTVTEVKNTVEVSCGPTIVVIEKEVQVVSAAGSINPVGLWKYGVEIVDPVIDGAETEFNIPTAYAVGTLRVYRGSPSGGAERLVDIIATDGTTVTLSTPPIVGETLYCDYIQSS